MKKILVFFIFCLFSIIQPVIADEANNILPSQTGLVVNVKYEDINNDAIQTKQVANIKILTGEFKGESIELDNILTGNPYYDIKLKKGAKVILHAEDNGNGVEFSIEDIKRSGTLIWLSALFCGLLIFVGRKKGIYSLVSIVMTIVLILNCLRPLILIGMNPILATILICVLSTARIIRSI